MIAYNWAIFDSAFEPYHCMFCSVISCLLLNFAEFPFSCEQYRGPFNTECLETIWQNIGCLLQGENAPKNYVKRQREAVMKMNLMQVNYSSSIA